MIAYLASLGETKPFPETEQTAQAPAETEEAAPDGCCASRGKRRRGYR